MGTTLRPAHALLLACTLLTAPARAQEPGGDAPDGVGDAQAFGYTPITGDLESTTDVDCFAIYITDRLAFSATTNGSSVPDPTLETKLYLWRGTLTGATAGIVFNDDDPRMGTNLSYIPAGTASLLTEGKHVICVTSFDNDPLNAAGLQIFDYDQPWWQVNQPNPGDGDANLASWTPIVVDDTGPYRIELTGVGGNPGACSLAINNPDISPNSVALGGTLTFSGEVVFAAGAIQKDVSLRATYDGPGGLSGSLALGSANNVPPGTYPFSRPVRVPGNAPAGAYVVTLQLIDRATGEVCDEWTETITATAPRLSGEVAEVAEPVAVARVKGTPRRAAVASNLPAFEVIALGAPLFVAGATTSSSAVSPNPFAGRTQIAYTVAAASNARLSVYDVLGREVAVLVDGNVEAGTHSATFDARGLSAGTYVYRLTVGSEVRTGRMTLSR
jgi:hypothetical protein